MAVSGEVDLVTDGERVVRVGGGHALPTRTTGAGCALGAVVAAYAAACAGRTRCRPASVVAAVAGAMGRRDVGPMVCDPVPVATGGDALAGDDVVLALREHLLPATDLLTPNAPEAAAMLGTPVAVDVDALADHARALLDLGPGAVLVEGGHLDGERSVDVLATTSAHGTGCTLSSALAARLAHEVRSAREDGDAGLDLARVLPGVVEEARDHPQEAVAAGAWLGVGHGQGPVHRAVRWW